MAGSVLFRVIPKNTVLTGTVTQNQATVIFDGINPMNTAVWSNTIDNDKPISQVALLPKIEKLANFPVKWSGADIGSGVKDFTIYVSDNGSAFTPWQTNTTSTQATFSGMPGHTYAFYSQARDNAYNVEPAHTMPDTTTKVHDLTLYQLKITPDPVVGSLNATGMVVMNGPTTADTVVSLVNGNSAATVPTSVTVPAGSSSQAFTITTTAVAAAVIGPITATFNGSHVSKSLTVRPIGVKALKLSAGKVKGGNSVKATVTLEAAAAPGDITVSFTSSNPALVPTPASITIPASSQTATATISTNTVTANTSVVITATANGISKSVKVSVTP